jgi:threonine synthase
MKAALQDFCAGYATQEQTSQMIASVYQAHGYILDPHTAVAASVYATYQETTNDTTTPVVVSTASPYKFVQSVLAAIGETPEETDDFALVDRLCEVSHTPIPQAIETLRGAKVLHQTQCDIAQMPDVIREFLE